jgi:glycosyltransferase involved in cell wall biosynthesis
MAWFVAMRASNLIRGRARGSVILANGRGRQIQNLGYAFFFLPVFLIIRIVTEFLSLIRFRKLIRLIHRLMRRDRTVLYLEVFFPENAGYHYRAQKWIETLNANGYTATVKYVFEREPFEWLLKTRRIIRFQTVFLLSRMWQCLASAAYGCVIVRRELLLFNDYGNLFLEKFLLAFHPNVILDFDDDIAAAKREPREIPVFGRMMLENPAKFSESLRLYSRFITGSGYLSALLQDRNSKVTAQDVVTIPTCVDYERYAAKVYDESSEYINFGWIGSAANHYLLDIVTPVLSQIARRHKIRFVLITNDGYQPKTDFEVVHVPWSLETEIQSLRRIDIGLMPLYDNPEERAKCGFKLIQYMGLGIVSIASAVTVNSEIVDDGENGFLVQRDADWLRVIEDVLARRSEFPRIGAAARLKVQNKYSFEANKQQYLDFIRASVA